MFRTDGITLPLKTDKKITRLFPVKIKTRFIAVILTVIILVNLSLVYFAAFDEFSMIQKGLTSLCI